MAINNNKDIERELEKRGVRPSPVKTLVFRTLDNAASPMSAQDIESELQTVDRSSISRILTTFVEAGTVHAISDGSGSMKYELCRRSHESGHSDEHIHFHCELCGRTLCLTDTPVPEITLPDGFQARKSNFVITGICAKCNHG